MPNFICSHVNGSTPQYVLVVPKESSTVAYGWLTEHDCNCDRVYTSNGTCRFLLINPSAKVIKAIAAKYPIQRSVIAA